MASLNKDDRFRGIWRQIDRKEKNKQIANILVRKVSVRMLAIAA